MDIQKTHDSIHKLWDQSIVSTISEYIKIPNQSPLFDPEWNTNGYLKKAVDLIVSWIKDQNVVGLSLEVVQVGNRTPVIFMELPATNGAKNDNTVLLYGHCDKQPPMENSWSEGLGPHTPVIRNNRLYGRGGADDGYAVFASIAAIKALQEQGVPHSKLVILIEACEESGSIDLPFYVEHLSTRIGKPTLVVCLDSGCGTYDQFWLTTSLRGMGVGTLTVKVLEEGVHSGHGSGIVPSSFRIIRNLLDRIEDSKTGDILIPELIAKIPDHRVEQARACATALGDSIVHEFLWATPNSKPVTSDLTELLLNRTWRPTLSVTGAEGWPNLQSAGNVLRSYTSIKLSLRVPPSLDAMTALQAIKKELERDPPYGALVTFNIEKAANGWESPALVPWLQDSLVNASNAFFNKPCNYLGEGGSIPFMGMLGEKFPEAQFVITGVLGPQSNAHGPNEFLDIPMGKNLTCCVAKILEDQYNHFNK